MNLTFDIEKIDFKEYNFSNIIVKNLKRTLQMSVRVNERNHNFRANIHQSIVCGDHKSIDILWQRNFCSKKNADPKKTTNYFLLVSYSSHIFNLTWDYCIIEKLLREFMIVLMRAVTLPGELSDLFFWKHHRMSVKAQNTYRWFHIN